MIHVECCLLELDWTAEENPEAQRGLVIASKILQQIANNSQQSGKAHADLIGQFAASHQAEISTFVDKLTV